MRYELRDKKSGKSCGRVRWPMTPPDGQELIDTKPREKPQAPQHEERAVNELDQAIDKTVEATIGALMARAIKAECLGRKIAAENQALRQELDTLRAAQGPVAEDADDAQAVE